jgi:HK97 family phage major capsid protein
MQEKLLTAFDNLTPKTKGAFDRLTQAKNHGGTDGELHAALRAVVREMRHEERMAFGDPFQRIAADEELNWEINAIVRRACLSRAGMPERYRAITEDATPGSTYVSAKLGAALFDLLALYGGWTTLGVQTMGSKTVNFPYLTARPKAIFVLTQGTQLTPDTNVAGSALSGDAVTIASMLAVSQEWMQDRDRDLCAVFLQSFEQAVNERLDTAFYYGNGVADADNGGITGIWQHADPTISTAASGNTTIETLDFEDLVNVLIATPAGVLQRGPIWWANPTSLARLMKVKDAAGRSVVQTPIEQPGRGIASILGYPVTPVAAAPSTNTAGSKVLAFGDGNAYAVGIRKAFALVGSDHCRFDYYSHVVLALSRAHGQMIRPAGFTLLALAAA